VAITDLIGALERADREGDTAPLPPAAIAALAHAEATLARWEAADLLDRQAAAARTYLGLAASTDWMAAGEFDRLLDIHDELAMYRQQAAAARTEPFGVAA
jgi:hypothetical protein